MICPNCYHDGDDYPSIPGVDGSARPQLTACPECGSAIVIDEWDNACRLSANAYMELPHWLQAELRSMRRCGVSKLHRELRVPTGT